MGLLNSKPKLQQQTRGPRRSLWQQTEALEVKKWNDLVQGGGTAIEKQKEFEGACSNTQGDLEAAAGQEQPARRAKRPMPAIRHLPLPPRQLLSDVEEFSCAGSGQILASPGREQQERALVPRPASKKEAMPSWDSLGIVITEEPTLTGAVTVCERDFPTAAPYDLWANTPLSIATPPRLGRISTGLAAVSTTPTTPARFSPACFVQPAAFGLTCWELSSINTSYCVGEGGQAAVYLADMMGVDTFCMKVAKTEEAKIMIASEARLTLMLEHPNLLQAYAQVLDCCGLPVGFTMEYLQGGDLHTAMQPNNPPFSLRQMALLMGDVARGVQHLHGQGVLHLDLKPSNIMLSDYIRGNREAPRAVVVDLGMTLLQEPGQIYALQPGAWGTLWYMDHDRVQDGQAFVTYASDVFSLGLVMYAMCAQADPFADIPEDLQWGLLKAKQRHHYLRRPPLCTDVWWSLIQWCTALEPWLRPTASQLLSELEGILAYA